jgi:NAD(P)-dependent dehydrogenase (short-subunit alcohol dehydrogenase family)
MDTSDYLIVLIMGANAGIGYYTSHQLAKTCNYTVLVGSSSSEKANDAIKRICADEKSILATPLVPIVIDITKDDTITAAAHQVETQYGHLDILINNAAFPGTFSGNTRRWRMEAVLDTNVTGTACVTDAFIPLLLKSTAPAPARRIVNIGSGLRSITLIKNGTPGAWQSTYTEYAVSKAALNMLSWHMLKKLEGDRVAVVVASPGYCATNLNEFSGPRTPQDGAALIVDAATKGSYEYVNGKFLEHGKEKPW